ncbi:hypothetical protein F7R01_15990 [Pseudomonas argentinensis]|uniref:Uncharacterized protein n=1 Tax=Phytopseudomonas argentinensis TaxID=289370 RepID=A0A1I3GSK1_9GAMM|nr:hypothetical protein [Pseudomonas argentinensis]KAB0548926.1 hypothetical protein F7R01_15990 [Pseudomonas argentinensis]SFI26394.1 hypothetical protein SAMN05216602_0325 [Pseudomonas argentinensis]
MNEHFPLAYRWFIAKGLENWEPWYLIDDKQSILLPPNLSSNEFASNAFNLELGADFDVYLFARRQDRDDFAFFVIHDGKIEDKVITAHLSFSKNREVNSPLTYEQIEMSFTRWIRDVVLVDLDDCMNEYDLKHS